MMDLDLVEDDDTVVLPGALPTFYQGPGSVKNELVVMEDDEEEEPPKPEESKPDEQMLTAVGAEKENVSPESTSPAVVLPRAATHTGCVAI